MTTDTTKPPTTEFPTINKKNPPPENLKKAEEERFSAKVIRAATTLIVMFYFISLVAILRIRTFHQVFIPDESYVPKFIVLDVILPLILFGVLFLTATFTSENADRLSEPIPLVQLGIKIDADQLFQDKDGKLLKDAVLVITFELPKEWNTQTVWNRFKVGITDMLYRCAPNPYNSRHNVELIEAAIAHDVQEFKIPVLRIYITDFHAPFHRQSVATSSTPPDDDVPIGNLE